MNIDDEESFSVNQEASAASSTTQQPVNSSHDHGGPTPNGVVSSHHGKPMQEVNHDHKVKKEHSKDKHKHKDHKHSKEHKPKENNLSPSKVHSSSKHHHHHDRPKEKTRDESSKDKHRDSSKSKHSSDKHKSKDDKHKHRSSSEHTGDKPKDPLKLVIKPKDGSVHHLEKHSSKHSSERPASEKHSEKPVSSEKRPPEKHSSDKHSSSDKHKVKHSSSSEKHSSDKHSSSSKKHSSEKRPSDKPASEKTEKHSSEKHKSEKVKSESGHKEKHKVKSEPVTSPLKVKTETEDDSPPPRQMVGMKSPSKMDKTVKKEEEESDDEPLAVRMEKVKKKKDTPASKKRKYDSDDEEDEDFKVVKKSKEKAKPIKKRAAENARSPSASPTKKTKKQEEEQDIWKWWEEEKKEDGVKWKTLEHQGPVFAPDYEPLPKNVKFYYDGKPFQLSREAEEVAGFYGRMLDHDYVTKESFNKNFFKDWKKTMTDEERKILTDLSKCNFKEIDLYYKQKSEERKAMTKEQKLEIKKENEELLKKYGFCIIDGHKQKIGNFKIEPPGLFRGRGEHPKMGMLKRRVTAKDVIINIGKEATPPQPPPGQKWKEVRHDNTVTWLACWTENILGSNKYIMLNPSSKLKGEKDWQKYELARNLKKRAGDIQKQYQEDWKSKEMRVRQRAVALYFIDKLALRAGNEKEEGETADTVGCCSLRVEHITLDDEKDGKECVVTFDFLGKDSIRYVNSVPVEKRVYKNVKLFMENKQQGDDLFDRLNTSILNKYLNDLMEGLTAKVFRTYNASKTLQEQLDLLTEEDMSIPEKMLAYNRANRAVAILCNHQRSVPKTFDKQMTTLQTKIQEKEQQIREQKKEVKAAKDGRDRSALEKKKKRLNQLEEQLKKLEVQATDKEENKQIALGTSKLNYLDPRISVAWCKKWEVPIEKIYNKTQRDKFRWAIEMATKDYKF